MSPPAIPDVITVVGTSYMQPLADLIEGMLVAQYNPPTLLGAHYRENGYAASITVLLVAMLESYCSRLRFKRREAIPRSKSTPDILLTVYSDLPAHPELLEVFLLRNLVIHNHIWHLDVSDESQDSAATIRAPTELGFDVNKYYREVVDTTTRRTPEFDTFGVPSA